MNKYTRTEERCFELGKQIRKQIDENQGSIDEAFRKLEQQRARDLEDLRRAAESRDATNRKGRPE